MVFLRRIFSFLLVNSSSFTLMVDSFISFFFRSIFSLTGSYVIIPPIINITRFHFPNTFPEIITWFATRELLDSYINLWQRKDHIVSKFCIKMLINILEIKVNGQKFMSCVVTFHKGN